MQGESDRLGSRVHTLQLKHAWQLARPKKGLSCCHRCCFPVADKEPETRGIRKCRFAQIGKGAVSGKGGGQGHV